MAKQALRTALFFQMMIRCGVTGQQTQVFTTYLELININILIRIVLSRPILGTSRSWSKEEVVLMIASRSPNGKITI